MYTIRGTIMYPKRYSDLCFEPVVVQKVAVKGTTSDGYLHLFLHSFRICTQFWHGLFILTVIGYIMIFMVSRAKS